jgi:hypothetical protein
MVSTTLNTNVYTASMISGLRIAHTAPNDDAR